MKHLSFSAVERIGTRTTDADADEASQRSRRASRPAGPGSGSDFRYFMDAQGRQHFNFVQRVWLHASVGMAVTPVMTLALETLAINLLNQLTRERNHAAAVGVPIPLGEAAHGASSSARSFR